MDFLSIMKQYDDNRDETRWLLALEILDSCEVPDTHKRRLMHELAAHPSCTEEVLTWLADSADHPVLERIAEHGNVSTEILTRLAQHDSPHVRAAAAGNGRADRRTQESLVADADPTVRHALAESYELPEDLLEILANDENPYVSYRATQTLHRLSKDRIDSGIRADSAILTVFLTEDDDFVRQVLRTGLKAAPELLLVGEAADGRSAVDQIVRLRPQVVLMDIGLPGIDGIQATRIIKASAPEVRILIVTAHDGDDDIIGAFQAGADGYFLKSSSNATLVAAIQQVYIGIPWFDPGVTSTVLRRCWNTINKQEDASVTEIPAAEYPVARLWEILMAQVERKAAAEHVYEAIINCQALVAASEAYYGGKSNPITTKLLSRLAELYYLDQDYKSSEEKYQQILHEREGACAAIDRALNEHVFMLARMYESQFDYAQAELYFAWSLRIGERLQDIDRITEAESGLHRVIERRGSGKQ